MHILTTKCHAPSQLDFWMQCLLCAAPVLVWPLQVTCERCSSCPSLAHSSHMRECPIILIPPPSASAAWLQDPYNSSNIGPANACVHIDTAAVRLHSSGLAQQPPGQFAMQRSCRIECLCYCCVLALLRMCLESVHESRPVTLSSCATPSSLLPFTDLGRQQQMTFTQTYMKGPPHPSCRQEHQPSCVHNA